MAFLGVFGESGEARAHFSVRADYLCAPVMHFSLDGRVSICYDGAKTLEELAIANAPFFAATACPHQAKLGSERLSSLFRRYGKRFKRYIPCPCAFALYDAKRTMLFFGGTHGEKCFMEEMDGAILFSSLPDLLREPIPVDFAILK